MGKYYAAAEALFSIIGLYGTACPVSELSSALIQLRCSFRPDMLFPERDARRYRRRHWRRQSFRITALAGTWRNDQYLFIHRNALLAFCFFYSMITHNPGLRSRLFQNQKHAELFSRVSAEKSPEILRFQDFGGTLHQKRYFAFLCYRRLFLLHKPGVKRMTLGLFHFCPKSAIIQSAKGRQLMMTMWYSPSRTGRKSRYRE